MADSKKVIAVIQAIGDKIIEEKDYLTELDNPIGDSDHGINMAKGFTEVKKKLPSQENNDIGTILKTVGMTLVSTVGGASGPLYGTAFMKAGMVLAGKEQMSFNDFLAAMDAAVEGVQMRGRSTVEEKTMLDAMVPALNAMKAAYESGQDSRTAIEAGAAAAEKGAEHTKEIIATKGRASYLGERSLGHQDPGAVSFTYMIQEISKNL
ncbi:dihydroxyacetone kinase subunit DhaL [Clostridium sp. AM58-1XD]|uniref:dihydroxyacetone kinase subunit DhaL n=1 Tax=Clostridium sp. AM58-1XD TaxID=2292307 RepID=UPI000E5032AA|nr:dihydroxyacetone kinase subunit DhaL [Clostridium sp. AM58-1XD]RGY98270.1 dihydroxyacetone kinase subunit L [Clostridium sp. AM58-1XD]